MVCEKELMPVAIVMSRVLWQIDSINNIIKAAIARQHPVVREQLVRTIAQFAATTFRYMQNNKDMGENHLKLHHTLGSIS